MPEPSAGTPADVLALHKRAVKARVSHTHSTTQPGDPYWMDAERDFEEALAALAHRAEDAERVVKLQGKLLSHYRGNINLHPSEFQDIAAALATAPGEHTPSDEDGRCQACIDNGRQPTTKGPTDPADIDPSDIAPGWPALPSDAAGPTTKGPTEGERCPNNCVDGVIKVSVAQHGVTRSSPARCSWRGHTADQPTTERMREIRKVIQHPAGGKEEE